MSLIKIFKKNRNIIIGALHFAPLFGYKGFPGMNIALKNAVRDLNAFQNGGVDGIIFENNYDIPHKEFVDPETISAMTFLGSNLREQSKLPLGVNVLWNDYRSALSIAKILKLKFIRVPVFVDKIKTSYGIISANPSEVVKFRKFLKADDVILLTDIHVKHSELLSKNSIIKSAERAIKNGSDGLVITGKWTGDPPDIRELEAVRKAVGNFPIFVGSGANKKNINELLCYANGVIVSTALKGGGIKSGEVNVKSYNQRIESKKVRNFVREIKKRRQ